MKKKRKIKCIAFDIGGVLQLGNYGSKKDHNLSVHEYVAKKLKKDLDSWFDSIDTTYALSIENKISKEKALSIISDKNNVSYKKIERILLRAYKKGFKKNKKLYKIAFKLKKQGYKIGILSDQWHLSSEVLANKKLTKGFFPVVISSEVGVRKPNLEIYKIFIKKSKCKANEILFIDNREWNLKPAKKLGMNTILFKDNEQTIRDLKKFQIKI
jgi:epoxide hydrolase-like predicted phosphatase